MTKTLEKTPNELQQKCIDSIDGKYLVLAGPGTGKTFTITSRIKNMVKNKGIKPEEILCLTFTDAAANEMRNRINKELEELSVGVNIYTYHSFCCEIIEENKDDFELPAKFRIITESISRAFIKECIDEISPKAYRTDKNDPYFYINTIKSGINEIKKNRLNKEKYFYNLEHNNDWIPELERKKGELKEKLAQGITRTKTLENSIADLEKKIEKAKELWTFYEKYQEKMTTNHYLDFDDMISFVLDKFEESPVFLSSIANKYKYILVDEYQDTNKSQNTIVLELARALDSQNIFVVGDDDQIIYTFQGAKLDTIENFLSEFPDTQVICLKENMRSTQSILDASRLVAIQDTRRLENNENFKQYNISKSLVAKNSEIIAKDKPVRFVEYVDDMQECNAIVDEIDALIKSDKFFENGTKNLSEIAILTANNDDLDVFMERLRAKSIPCELKTGIDIFSNHAVNVLFSYMQMLVNPELYSQKIFQILLSQPFNINPKDYQKIFESVSKYKTPLDCMRSFKEEDFVNSFMVERFLETYDYLSTFKNNESIRNTVLEIGAKTGIFDYYLNFEINRSQNIASLKKLVEEASVFSDIYKTCFLEEFVEYLNILLNDEISILTDKAPVTLNAVQLSTYHSAKGKEFAYVYMPTLIDSKWESNKKSNSISIPLSPSEYKTEEERKELKYSDKIKTLYVGMTRARHSLTLSYPLSIGNKPKKLSEFINNIKDSLAQEKAEDYNIDSYWMEASKTLVKSDYDYIKDFADMLNVVLTNKKYSPTALNKYLKCPRQYLYSNLLAFDGKDGNPDVLSYGSAIHYACEFAVNYAIEKGCYPEKSDFIKAFLDKLSELPLSSYKNRENIKGRGINALDGFYNQLLNTPVKELNAVETKFEFDMDGYKFHGIVDRIDKNSDGTYSIYDYKTGNAKTTKEVCPDGDKEEYYNQMAFYKYMFETSTGKKVSKTEFIFPEDFTKNLEVIYTQEKCNQVMEKYKSAIDKINALEFEPSYDKKACEYCSYLDFCNSNIL